MNFSEISTDNRLDSRLSLWYLWRDRARSPALNMAIDETLLLQAETTGLPVLRFYGWDQPAISIGRTQKYELTARPGVALVRRPTGGGVVEHDHDFTYSVTIPACHWIADCNRRESYRIINTAIRTGLERAHIGAALADQEIPGSTDRASMICFENPTRYDLLANGSKIAGSAQRRTKKGILHQGSIHFGGRLSIQRRALEQALVEGFEVALGIKFQSFPDCGVIENKANPLAQSRYADEEWNRRQ